MAAAAKEEDVLNLDAITSTELRDAGGVKWSQFPEAIGAFIAEMDFGIPPQVTEVLNEAARTGALGYLPAADKRRAQEACARWQARDFGWQVHPEQVFLLPDVLSTMRATIQRFTPPDSPIVVPTPAYMPFLTVARAAGRQVLEVPSRRDENGSYSLDYDGIDAALGTGARLVVLCNPWNPVGRVLRRAELEALRDIVDRHGARVFADEVHAPLLLDDVTHLPYASLDATTASHTLTGTGASKGWNIPGLKCGQLILSNPADVEAFEPVADDVGDAVGLLGPRAAAAVYDEGADWLVEVVEYLRGNRDLLTERLAEIPGVEMSPIEGTFIAWLDCRGLQLPGSPTEFFRREAGVALTEGAACGAGFEDFVRFTFAMPRPILREALDGIAAAVARR